MDLYFFWFQVAMPYVVYYSMIYSPVPVRQNFYGDGNGAAKGVMDLHGLVQVE